MCGEITLFLNRVVPEISIPPPRTPAPPPPPPRLTTEDRNSKGRGVQKEVISEELVGCRCLQRFFLTRYPSPATRHPLPVTRYPSPATRYPPPATRHPSPVTRHPPPAEKSCRFFHRFSTGFDVSSGPCAFCRDFMRSGGD